MKLALLLMAGVLLSQHASAADCNAVMGNWSWFTGGEVAIDAGGVLKYNGSPAGSWNCASQDAITLHWKTTGTTDSLRLSRDGRSLSGRNATGVAVSGQRIGESPAGSKEGAVSKSAAAASLPKIIPPIEHSYDPETERLFQQAAQLCHFDSSAACARAVPFAQKAAERGHAKAQGMFGIMYREGYGVRQNKQQALSWLQKAAAQDNRGAEYQLGDMYELGDGVPADMHHAAEYFAASARQGFAESQFELGLMCELGEGVARSRELALFWVNQAAQQGHDDAAILRSFLQDPQTPAFQNEDQFFAYIRQHMAPQLGTSAGTSYVRPGQVTSDWYGKKNALTGQNCANPSCR